MDAETPPCSSGLDEELDSSIHGFNTNNVTVIERTLNDGSDSGVEAHDTKDSASDTSSTSSRPSTSSKKKVAVQSPVKNIQNKKAITKKPSTPRPSTLKTVPSTPSTPRAKPADKNRIVRSASTTRTPKTPALTPTDDGRWPSNTKNAMTRSFRSTLTQETASSKSKIVTSDNKNNVLDKYATLPRRRRERSADNIREPSVNRATNLRKQLSRESTPARTLPPYPKKKTKIFAETTSQTSLTLQDICRLVDSGTLIERGHHVEKEIQTEKFEPEIVQTLRKELQNLQLELNSERTENLTLKEELQNFQKRLTLSEISRSELEQTHQELESESRELQDFLGAEKWALCEALAEAEARISSVSSERTRLRHEVITAEVRTRDLLLAQGAAVSGAAVALSGLSHRLDALATRLANAYNISEAQLTQDVFHNEAYDPESPDQENGGIIQAIVQAIRHTNNIEDENDISSETEPCLMMDNVLEDVVNVDTHSVNLISEPAASASSLLDQVIEADNLLTRLLLVLREVQKSQKNEEQGLRDDLQRHRTHVERLTQDVCALSTACSTQQNKQTALENAKEVNC